ncbi:hypothetical protein ACS0X5_06295 [Burkholderia gladioli]|uniref:hypothetical protein n=1 Tax=Burkholderia gladioli TaxID=28095 RepID=UPI003F78D36F
MNDRELLELAAKAAAIVGTYVRIHQAYGDQWVEGIDTGALVFWNPLTDDGDALRLAVKLSLLVAPRRGESICTEDATGKTHSEAWHFHGKEVATRRAITRAAAEIGARITTEDGK